MSKQNNEGKATKTKTPAKAATKKVTPEKADVIEPDVLPREDAPTALILTKRDDDTPALHQLEASIQRDIQLSSKLDKAGAMVSVKIGLALQSAKSLLRHGEYEGWVGSRFGDLFSRRRAQYCAKLATSFLRSDEGAMLTLPAPRDAGNWLVVADEGSQLQGAVETFVGDMTMGELLDKHGVRPTRGRGGWRPAAWLVAQFQAENPHLQNKVFDVWSQEDQGKFKAWQETQVDGNDAAARRMAAESAWHGIRMQLADHGITRKSYTLLSAVQIEETREILALVGKEISKVLKVKEG